jgi:hypothetical protein
VTTSIVAEPHEAAKGSEHRRCVRLQAAEP